MAANTTGYGAQSVSLLSGTGNADSVGSYVLSGSNGHFSLTGLYSCTASQQVYILALGGNPGLTAGTNNSAIAEMAVLGACPLSGSFAASYPFVIVNEVTTVAAVYALSGFLTDATHVSSSGTAKALTGVANAFLTPTDLVDVSTGIALTSTVGNNNLGTQANFIVNTLANITAACIDTDGTGSVCSTLPTEVLPHERPRRLVLVRCDVVCGGGVGG